VRQHGAGVNVDGVAARGLHDGDPGGSELVAQIGHGADAVAEVVLVQHLLDADGEGLQIVAGEAAVGGKAFGEDEIVAALGGERVVVEREEAADVHEAVLLGRHGAAVGEFKRLPGDGGGGAVGLAGLALLDEPGVFGEAAGIENEWDGVRLAQGRGGVDVGEADRLAAAGVVRDGDHHERDAAPVLRQAAFERDEVDVALEGGREGRLCGLGAAQIQRRGADGLEVGAGGVEMRVVRHDVAGAARGGEQDALGRAALVRGDDVAITGDLAHGRLEAEERAGPGVGFIAGHHAGPLGGGHGAGAGVGQQVDDDVLRLEEKEIVVGGGQRGGALLAGGEADGLDRLDAKRFDDGLELHGRGGAQRRTPVAAGRQG
jgi:hypothetical protein